jgi:Holliday junction resolvase RusA-like endonuclease
MRQNPAFIVHSPDPSTELRFWIPGDPKGQPRPRAFARRMGAKFVARMYDSDAADEWKAAVDAQLVEIARTHSLEPFAGRCSVILQFYFQRPKSHLRTNGTIKEHAPVPHTSKPDLDNLAKLVLDRITRNGRFWADDAQVDMLAIGKEWAKAPASGGVLVTIRRGT